MNLTPPPPSQNSHAVRWHCTAELLLLICTRRMLTAEYTKIVRLQTVRLSKNVFNSKTSVAAANRQHQVGLIWQKAVALLSCTDRSFVFVRWRQCAPRSNTRFLGRQVQLIEKSVASRPSHHAVSEHWTCLLRQGPRHYTQWSTECDGSCKQLADVVQYYYY